MDVTTRLDSDSQSSTSSEASSPAEAHAPPTPARKTGDAPSNLTRRNLFLNGATLASATALATGLTTAAAPVQQAQAQTGGTTGAAKPNILVIMGDDVGYWNISAYHRGIMGYNTPNIDRLAKEGGQLMSYYAQQSCTAGRSAFITGQMPFRTGLSKVGLPGADLGLRKEDPTIAELLKPLGYVTG